MIGEPEGVRHTKHSIDVVIDGSDPGQAALEKMFIEAFGKECVSKEDLPPSNHWILRVLPGGLLGKQR